MPLFKVIGILYIKEINLKLHIYEIQNQFLQFHSYQV